MKGLGNVENWAMKRILHFVDIPDSRRTLSLELPKDKAEGL